MDKKVTRAANSGATRYSMFGKVWTLSPGLWSVKVWWESGFQRGRLVQIEAFPNHKREI